MCLPRLATLWAGVSPPDRPLIQELKKTFKSTADYLAARFDFARDCLVCGNPAVQQVGKEDVVLVDFVE